MAVGSLIDRGASSDDLTGQGLHLLAADHWRARGDELPPLLVVAEFLAVQRLAAVKTALAQCREAFDGRFVVLKGPEVASHYPREELRSFGDLDLLSDEPERLHAELIGAGFTPHGARQASFYTGLHHLQPLRAPGSDELLIEVHRHPSWVRWNDPPSFDALYAGNVESTTGVPGVRALDPAAHAVVVAVHHWAESPLSRVADLVDVAALLQHCDREAAAARAREWDVAGLWETTVAAADALLLGRGRSTPLRTWARSLTEVRRRTVFETHVRRWVSPFWARRLGPALASSALAVWHDLTPGDDETWGGKLSRARRAVRNPSRPNEEHERSLGPRGIQPRLRRRP